MHYYVDCSCVNHNKFQSFQDKVFAKAYYDSLNCKKKIFYQDTIEVDRPDQLFDVIEQKEI